MTPEARARQTIDALLTAAGWHVCDVASANLRAATGVAIREFPLDPLAMAGFMLSRCADDDKWYPLLDRLYQTKEDWAHADNPVEAMVKTLSPYGMTPELFNSCVTRSDLFDKVYAVSERGKKEFGVNATPTFFINGVQRQGALTIQQFDEILAPMLAARP